MNPPVLTFAFELRAVVGAPEEIGESRAGRRRIVPILGGTAEGPELRGTIVPGGADWQLIQPDGFSELDTRYVIQADDGAMVYVQNTGMRHAPREVMMRLLAGQEVDPALVYFRTVPRFETAAASLQWLTRSVFIGVGTREPDTVIIQFFKVE